MQYRIMVSDSISPEGVKVLQTEADVILSDDPGNLGEVDALIVRSRTKVKSDWIAKGMPRLRVIGRAGVGVDNIDIDAACSHGVIVVNAPEAATAAVAEHTIGLMLALSRQIPTADRTMKDGEWRKSEFMGVELQGKTLGIIGVGRIGTAVADRAVTFGMEILGCDPYVGQEELQSRPIDLLSFDELLARSDFISIHVPLNEETLDMFNTEAFSKVKHGARLIFTARGGVVNETALLEALNAGTVSGAALDVFENEPTDSTTLVGHPRVISTPHIGAQTTEAQIRAGIDIATEVLAALNGKPLRWQVI